MVSRLSLSTLGMTGLSLALAASGRMLDQIQSQRGKTDYHQRTPRKGCECWQGPLHVQHIAELQLQVIVELLIALTACEWPNPTNNGLVQRLKSLRPVGPGGRGVVLGGGREATR